MCSVLVEEEDYPEYEDLNKLLNILKETLKKSEWETKSIFDCIMGLSYIAEIDTIYGTLIS